jgi:hypothetical protein
MPVLETVRNNIFLINNSELYSEIDLGNRSK